MYIVALTVPSSRSVFNEETDEEFKFFCQNINAILEKTRLIYRGEINADTNQSLHLWSTSDCFSYESIGGVIDFQSDNKDNKIIDISDIFFEEILMGFDLFSLMHKSALIEASDSVNNELVLYSVAACDANQ